MAATRLLFRCAKCETAYHTGVPLPCPVCTQYGGLAPRFLREHDNGLLAQKFAGMLRPVFVCGACEFQSEVALKRCPICRRERKAARRRLKSTADSYRKRIPKARRARIYERDGHACLRCGSHRKLTLDHVVPIAQGGTNAESNLQTLCEGCNCSVKRGKATDYRAKERQPCEPGELRESTTLGWIKAWKGATAAERQRYTRHAAVGHRTLCG